LAQFVWGLVIGEWWVNPPKKRYKHIPVRLGSAIHGSAHFWEDFPTTLRKLFSSLQFANGLVFK